MEMDAGEETSKQDKRRMGIRVAGSNAGGMAVWGGVAVLAATFVVVSVSSFISKRKNDSQDRSTHDLNKGKTEAGTPTGYDNETLEIIAKAREDKTDLEKEAPTKLKETNKEATNNGATQKHHLTKGLINPKENEAEKEMIVAVPNATYNQSERVQEEMVVEKDDELAEEIEADTRTKLGGENEEDGNEDSSICEDETDIAEEVTYLQHAEKQENHNGEREAETAPQLNQFACEGKLQIKEEYSVNKEENQENHEGKAMAEPAPFMNQSANKGNIEVQEELVHEEEEQENNDRKVVVETAPFFDQFANEGCKLEVKEEESIHEDEKQEYDKVNIMMEKEEEFIHDEKQEYDEVNIMMEKEEESSETSESIHETPEEEVNEVEEAVHKEEEPEYDEERVMLEMAFPLNQFTNECKLVVKEESVCNNGQEYDEGKVIMGKEEESSETNEEEEVEESEESSEGTGDFSMESNVDAIWPAEAMEDIIMEIKQRKTDDQISENKTADYIKVETERTSQKSNNDYATNRGEIEDFVFNSRKRHLKELLLDLTNRGIFVWAILVIVLALAAPMVLMPRGILKL